ncbi:hypothetical protein ONZ45_g6943 [Pleurotus djamor]|nr:hypothetical protein ONZ45_g6943 [Pleurotus djamor]
MDLPIFNAIDIWLIVLLLYRFGPVKSDRMARHLVMVLAFLPVDWVLTYWKPTELVQILARITASVAIDWLLKRGIWDPSRTLRTHRTRRLFDTQTRTFTHGSHEYAILSHRWDAKELTYDELLMQTSESTSNAKFNGFCKIASEMYACRYVWMDSVCINKGDVDELDESIRSMHLWYQNANDCVVYFSDVSPYGDITKSSWFTRGWTLQEFLAPKKISFFYNDWTPVSSFPFTFARFARKTVWNSMDLMDFYKGYDRSPTGDSLRTLIANAAGIDDPNILSYLYEPDPANLQVLLNWARSRQTTKPEDSAYSLISLLNICIPVNYGEGAHLAHERLTRACQLLSTPNIASSSNSWQVCYAADLLNSEY